MNRFTGSALLLLTLVFNACRVSTKVSLPQSSLPAEFRDHVSTDTTTIADIPWKTFFADVTLQQLIDSALINNYDMQYALKNMEAAQLMMRQAKWNYVPAASLNVTASTNRPSDNSLNGISLNQFLKTTHIEDYTAGLTLSWEADIWGKIRNQRKSALAKYLQSAEARKLVQTSLVTAIAQGYYNLLMLDEQLLIAQRNVALNDSTLQMIRLQYDAGQVTSLAVEYAVAQQLTAAALVPQMEQNIALQENALRILTGALPDKVNRSSNWKDQPFADALPAGIPASLLSRRPDIKTQELALAIADANTAISKSMLYPSLRITAGGGVNAFKASNWFNIPASLFGTVAGGLAQPLLQHKELKTRYEVAKTEREQAVIRFRQSVLLAVGEVADALVRIDKLKEQYDITASRVQTLHQATGNAHLLFRNGMADYLEVITAESNVLRGELELAAIKRSELAAVTDLYKALGGGWR